MATKVGPEVQWIADFPQAELPCRECNHGWRRVDIALSQAILGSKFWALGGLNQKSKNNVLYFLSWRTDGQEMARFHRETKKKNQCLWQTDGHTYRQTESTTKNNRLLARRGDQQFYLTLADVQVSSATCHHATSQTIPHRNYMHLTSML